MFLCVIVLVIYFRIPQVLRIRFLFPTSCIRALVRVGAMTEEDGKSSGIEKFDGTNFGYWKMQIEDYLYAKKLHLPLLGKKPDKMEDTE